MCMIFRMEDLVASAFIGLMKKNMANRKITLHQLALYKNKVLKRLNNGSRTAIIPISQVYTDRFLYIFDDYFSSGKNDENDDCICLREGKTLEELRRKFSIYIPHDVRDCFEDERNLEPILSKTS